jgi:hypothetical protein
MNDPEGVARVIAGSKLRVPVHLAIVVGIMLMLGDLVALYQSIRGGVAGALARLGLFAGVAGVTIGLVLVILDGVAAYQLAQEWAAAPPGDLAVALSRVYPRGLGWVVLVAGVASVGAGLVQAFTGEPTEASRGLTIFGPTVITLWLLVVGILLVRGQPLTRVAVDS